MHPQNEKWKNANGEKWHELLWKNEKKLEKEIKLFERKKN